MVAPVSTELRTLANRLAIAAVTSTDPAATIAMADAAQALLTLADKPLAELPKIDPIRDDVAHWRALPEQRLRNENACDAWNLAAGLHVAAERAAAAQAAEKRAAVIL